MAYSIQQVVSDGNVDYVDLTIDYIDKSHILVFIDDLEPSASGYTWAWATYNRINITPTVASGSVITIKRNTKRDEPYHLFNGGARFAELSVDENFKQALFIAQEAIEASGIGDFFQPVDMHGYRIQNLGTAIDPADAVSLAQYQADALGAAANRIIAESSAAAVAADAATASAAATTAVDAANAVGTGVADAQTAASSAQDSALLATNAKDQALVYLNEFKGKYFGAASTPPTQDPLGNPPDNGDMYINTVDGLAYYWYGGAWVSHSAPNAAAVVCTPPAGLTATDVQAALNEISAFADDQAIKVTNVATSTASVVLSAALPIGTRWLVRKVNPTQGTVTISCTGHTFTRAALSSVSLNANGDFWLLEKVSASRIEILAGFNSGSNANGSWTMRNDGSISVVSNTITVTTADGPLAGLYYSNATFTYPTTVASAPVISVSVQSDGTPAYVAFSASAATAPGSSSAAVTVMGTSSTGTANAVAQVDGRWYA